MSLSRFKASLVSAVIADCIGALFEGVSVVRLSEMLQTVHNLEKNRAEQREHGRKPADQYGLNYTDDTAMARSVAASLIEHKTFDARDMAKRFADCYFAEPGRGYGGNIVTVFELLRDPDLKDVFEPASQQFDGSGSYGNGGAMRIAPSALFNFHRGSINNLEALVTNITRLTHSNAMAIRGAFLQALAVDQSLRLPVDQKIDVNQFVDALIDRMERMETERQEDSPEPPPLKKSNSSKRRSDLGSRSYCKKLEMVKEMATREDLKVREVVDELGNNVSAYGSVPAAILSFLRVASMDLKEFDNRNKLEQTILYAISLGGDTDTIATMAAAIAGAFYGMEHVPEAWQYYCEGVADAETMAEELFKLGVQSPNQINATGSS